MNPILIIEDNMEINQLIADTLKNTGYPYIQAFSGTEGLLNVEKQTVSLVLLDLMLPGMTGEVLLPKIKATQNVPVIVLSAKDALDSKVSLLSSGAEDYITKPFEIKELLARIGVQLRRFTDQSQPDEQILSFQDIQLFSDSFTVRVNGTALEFTKQEFKILELLLSHPHKVFSKQEIYDYAWDDIYIGEDKTVNVHISNIRKKLKSVSETEYIETIWGIGFRLKQSL